MTPLDPSAPIRWGVVSTGRIANSVTTDLQALPDGLVLAVASRDIARAQSFAETHGIQRAYGSYAELFADPDIDVVYIATPHRQHHAIARAALLAGKAALVEKAFTVTVAGAEDVLALARDRGLFVMEAMWTRFLPIIAHLREIVADGVIGEVHSIRADLGFVAGFDAANRFWDPAQGGGALLDMGIYPISFAQMLLGDPTRVQVTGRLAETGVDAAAALLTDYAGGAHALLETSIVSDLPGVASIIGAAGRIDVAPRFHHTSEFVIRRRGHDDVVVDAAGERATVGGGYTHELVEVQECLRAGRLESTHMPWADTLTNMRTMQDALQALSIEHTEDPDAMGAAPA